MIVMMKLITRQECYGDIPYAPTTIRVRTVLIMKLIAWTTVAHRMRRAGANVRAHQNERHAGESEDVEENWVEERLCYPMQSLLSSLA